MTASLRIAWDGDRREWLVRSGATEVAAFPKLLDAETFVLSLEDEDQTS